MDYEKNKTLAILKQMVADGKITQEDAEKYFPELSGKRDELLKDTLIHFLQHSKYGMHQGIMLHELIEWVLRQAKQGEILRYEVDDYCASITKCPHKQKSCFVDDAAAFVGSLSCGRCPFYGGKAGSRGIYCKYKEKQGEQKPADWSEEDTKWAEEIRLALRLYSKDKLYVERLTNWFNNHVQPQTKQEWSEEERDIITGIIRFLQTLASRNDNQTFYSSDFEPTILEKWVNWLKSHLRPQNLSNVERIEKNWKPTKEQLQALEGCVDFLENSDNEDLYVMESLLEQLKAL